MEVDFLNAFLRAGSGSGTVHLLPVIQVHHNHPQPCVPALLEDGGSNGGVCLSVRGVKVNPTKPHLRVRHEKDVVRPHLAQRCEWRDVKLRMQSRVE